MKRLLFAGLFVLAGCGDSRIDAVERRVGQRLKDPTTAIFSNIRINNDPTHPIACGEVNARNSFGAYEGMQEFIMYTGMGVRFSQDDDPIALSRCCDVLLEFEPGPGRDVQDEPGFQKTCGRLDLFGTLQ